MHIISKISPDAKNHESAFSQGANLILSDGALSVAVWLENTPDHEGKPCVAIGACSMDGAEAVRFLKQCINYIRENYEDRSIIGPMNGNTWMKHRLILESDGSEAFLMEPFEPRELKDTFLAAGFVVLSSYSSSVIDLTVEQKKFNYLEKLVAEKGVTIREIDESRYEADLMDIYELSLAAFSDNFLYTALPQQAFIGNYLTMKEMIDPDFVLLAHIEDELVGFLFCLPAEKSGSLIVKTLATSPHHQTTGLGTLLVAMAQAKAKEKGYKKAIHALQYEGNSSLRISQRFDAVKFRTYGLMIVK